MRYEDSSGRRCSERWKWKNRLFVRKSINLFTSISFCNGMMYKASPHSQSLVICRVGPPESSGRQWSEAKSSVVHNPEILSQDLKPTNQLGEEINVESYQDLMLRLNMERFGDVSALGDKKKQDLGKPSPSSQAGASSVLCSSLL